MKPSSLLCMLLIAIAAPACADRDDSGSTSESEVRTSAHRSRLARLSNVDALARLYVGHELRRDELLALGSKSEGAVIDALAARADFTERYIARIAEFSIASGHAPTSKAADPQKPLVDAFDGKKADADRFARWLTQSLAPRVASDVIAKNEATLAQMTYRDLLDTIRRSSGAAK
jgi:hypothetical protein